MQFWSNSITLHTSPGNVYTYIIIGASHYTGLVIKMEYITYSFNLEELLPNHVCLPLYMLLDTWRWLLIPLQGDTSMVSERETEREREIITLVIS